MGTQIYTDEQIADALRQAKGIQSEAAYILGCDPSTVYARVKASDALREVVNEGLAILRDKSHKVVGEALDDDEDKKIKVDTAKWVLARLGKDTWSERQEIAGPDGGPVSVELAWPEMEAE